MKRVLALMSVFAFLMAFCGLVYAEGIIDFSEYSLEVLIQIKEDLANEIAKRPGGERMVIGAGQYKVGEDIPAGIYTFKYIQNGDSDVSRTDYYVYENESMYKYDIDRLWLGDMPRVEGSLEGDGETRISLYSGEYLRLGYNGAEIERVGNVEARVSSYEVPQGTSISTGDYTIGEEILAGTYSIYYGGKSTSRVRVFQDFNESDNSFNKGKETVLNELNTEGMVTLIDGNILRVEYTPIVMTKSDGFNFD